ncbi:MAG: protein phosphatase 2C domain-containing protein [Cyanobacteria bacterium P01_D01_bin.56]
MWVAGSGKIQQLDRRYSWKHQRVVLDTQPGLLPPESPDPVPTTVLPYLTLAPYSLHVPQPYALIQDAQGKDVLLLDKAPLIALPGSTEPKLLPSFRKAWKTASPLRQLNWLWQIAGLWPHFLAQRVASNLLPGERLRVDGGMVRLLELSLDIQPPSLQDLATAWQSFLPESHDSIRAFLGDLCHQLLKAEINTAPLLQACLNQAIADIAQGYQCGYELSVMTDPGPSRKRNEDACYPPSGKTQTHRLGPKASDGQKRPLLLLVCDGIGGHEGGDVASRLAISTVQQQLAPLLDQLANQPVHNPATVVAVIKQAIATANDHISQHNDQGLRQARNRMGTTLVLALVVGVHVYIAHVGDSRAYAISTNSCQQITFDDDVAAREVRLGYGFYADVVNRPGTGALIQALGMGGSAALHINIQNLILDGDMALLLCSDGLSDYDRVDQFWTTYVRPIVLGKNKPASGVSELIQLANTHNGHDNVTVGIFSGHSQGFNFPKIPLASPAAAAATLPPIAPPAPFATAVSSPSPVTVIPQKTSAGLAADKKRSFPLLWTCSLLALVATSTALTMVFFRNNTPVSSTDAAPPLPETIQDKITQNNQRVGISDDELPPPTLTPGSYLRLTHPILLTAALQPSEAQNEPLGQLSDGGIVQVLTQQELAGEEARWIKVKVCSFAISGQLSEPDFPEVSGESEGAASISETNSPESDVTQPGLTSLTSGAEGWILEAKLASSARDAAAHDCS